MKIEIWGDVACPWNYISKRRLERALATFDHRDQVQVVWRSLQIDPDAAAGVTVPILDFVTADKGLTTGQARRMFDDVTAVAAKEGLAYDLAAARHTSTFDGHRLLHWAAERGRADAMIDRLLSGYLQRGESVGDPDTLVAMATQVGLDAGQARHVLASGRYTDRIRTDQAEAARRGITVGPYLLFDGDHGVSGHSDHAGADPAVIPTALHAAWARAHPAATAATGTR